MFRSELLLAKALFSIQIFFSGLRFRLTQSNTDGNFTIKWVHLNQFKETLN